MGKNRVSRREFLGVMGLGAAALAFKGAGITQASSLIENSSLQRVLLKPSYQVADVEINMRATTSVVPVLPGDPTQVMKYEATLVKGSASNLVTLPDNYLGPIIRVRQGQRLKVNFTNNLPEDTTVHFHGPCIPSNMGGHPHGTDVVHPGKNFTYEFDALDRASPFWFHPHPDLRTAFQVYYGLAGLYFITDDLEAQAGLDTGEYDVPLVIQDRTFDANNQFVYLSGGMGMMGGMMGMMQGFMGNRILVNGKPDYVQPLAPGTYRLRLYNGSNARTYRLAWQDGTPLTVLGTDGGLLPKAVQRSYIMLAPAERVDLWVDFSGKQEGTELVMQSLSFQAGMMGGMGGGMGRMGGGRMGGTLANQAALPHGAAFPVFKVRIQGAKKQPLRLPPTFVGSPPFQLKDVVNINSPRTIVLGMQRMTFTVNGRLFEMDAIAPDEYVPFNTLEAWDFVNYTMIAHPMHIHNVQFNIVERQPGMAGMMGMSGSTDYQSVKAGFIDEGWKDTVLVLPGERVRILVKFLTYEGMYMYHCHILEHEVMGMMRNLMIGQGSMDSMNMP